MQSFFHATAAPNHKTIRTKGLQTCQRGVNQFGLDAGVDYANVYNNANAVFFQKTKSIHLATTFQQAAKYGSMIAQLHNTTTAIYEVQVESSQVKKDPEDPNSVYITKDIPAKNITMKGLLQKK